LQKSKDKLAELLELNKTPEGQKQGQQLANEIAAEKAHIDSINTSIQAISVQNEAMKNQMEVVKAQNQQAVADGYEGMDWRIRMPFLLPRLYGKDISYTK